GQGMSGAYSFDPGDRRKLREQSVDKTDLAWDGIEFVGQRDVEVDSVCGVETRVNVNYVEHAADEQSSAHEQRESESGLGDDQRMMKPVAVAPGRGRKPGVSQGSGWI